LGTRPEIIRLSQIIFKLKQVADVVVVNTNQNFDPKLNENFLQELGIHIDHNLNARGTFSEQCAGIFMGMEHVITQEKPHKFLVLGDTNSGLGAIIAKKMGIPVYHLEAGNRCFDDAVPEEVNRRVIDHCSDILMPYTERAKENLVVEGIPRQRIYIIGNPIFEVINHYTSKARQDRVWKKPYYLITLHRSENVDNEERFARFLHLFTTFAELHKDTDVIVSTHPHTRLNMTKMGIAMDTMPKNLIFSEPFGFTDFINLELNAKMVFTDSGTVQEECSILKVPNMTLRTTTERPETIESGSNILMNQDFDLMNNEYFQMVTGSPPSGYLDENVSDKVVRIILGHYQK
jgi:UDP-N-acetylglucosamine 2-epimerase (non-hydrolysing)